jgi:membrane associated rhomboid family serine protease
MRSPVSAEQPIFNVPKGVLIASAIMIATQIALGGLPDDTALYVVRLLAFIPARYSGGAAELPGGYVACITSFVTYMVVHAGWMHLLVNLAWMVAFGSGVERRIGEKKFFIFSILCGIAGALTHLGLHFGEITPVVGASAAISGQMAAALRVVFGEHRRGELGRLDFAQTPLPSLVQSLTDPRMILIIVMWAGLNLIFGLGAVTLGGVEGEIAWEAHVGGFLFGLLFYGFFDHVGAVREEKIALQ